MVAVTCKAANLKKNYHTYEHIAADHPIFCFLLKDFQSSGTSINLSSSLTFTNTQEHILRVVIGITQPISDHHRHCKMDEELSRRRNTVREKYALLRAEHPALPPVLRDFQVQGACLKMSYIISVFRKELG